MVQLIDIKNKKINKPSSTLKLYSYLSIELILIALNLTLIILPFTLELDNKKKSIVYIGSILNSITILIVGVKINTPNKTLKKLNICETEVENNLLNLSTDIALQIQQEEYQLLANPQAIQSASIENINLNSSTTPPINSPEFNEDTSFLQEDKNIQKFNPQDFFEEVTGIAILGNSGSAKTCLVNYFCGELSPAPFIILDPHADTENPEYPWVNYPLIISNKEEILEVLENLLLLLDQKNRDNLVIVCDEYPAIRSYALKLKSSVADDFILRYGSEARKFNKLPIFISQSGNVKSLGLEGQGDFLENFGLIRLGKIADKFLKFSKNTDIRESCKKIPYPMLIGEDDLYLHPTHGHYHSVKKSQPPLNIKPIQCLDYPEAIKKILY